MDAKKPLHRKPGRPPKKPAIEGQEEKPKHVPKARATAKTHALAKPTTVHPEPKPVVARAALAKPLYAVGRRKTAVAQVLLAAGNGTITVNALTLEGYFATEDLQKIVLHPLQSVGLEKGINIKAKIHGGGIHAQAESLRHAISRALTVYNPESRRVLKKQGFLTRDPRVKERKKPGLKRARRAPQFSKR